MNEVETHRIRELSPEAAIRKRCARNRRVERTKSPGWGAPKKFVKCWPSEATNRQAFMQQQTVGRGDIPGRVVTDPLFKRVRFDVLIVEDAPHVPAPFLLGRRRPRPAAGRQPIIIAGDTQDLHT